MKSLNAFKIIRLVLFNGLLLMFQTKAFSQYTVEYSKVIQPSPNAASLGSFGNNSKGTYNGVPEISIPLFQNIFPNQAGNIALHYDASGTKAAQQASWVGLGWSLGYGGGVITRTVRGLDDLYSGGYHEIHALPSATVLSNYYSSHGANDPNGYLMNYMMGVASGQVDTEPDIFNFNIGNYNDKFVFDKVGNGSSVVQLEGSNLKIVYLNPGWKITDGDGNKYYFNQQEWAESWSTTNDHDISYSPAPNDFVDNSNTPHDIITAWYLDSIVTAKSDRIRFFYSSERTLSLMQKSEKEYTLFKVYSGCATPNMPNPYHTYTSSQQILASVIPSSISFPNGSVEFHKAPRTDINDIYGANSASSLDYIVEKDKDGLILKKIKFYYSYFNQYDSDPTNKRLKLDSVKDESDAVRPIPAYKMIYYNPQSLPPKITKAIDHWGYFNNQTDNQTLLVEASANQPYYRYFPGSNRRPDTALASVQNGVLSSLTYPTGGRTNFKYELNEYTTLYGNDRFDVKDTTILLGPSQANANWTGASFTLTEATDIKFEFNYWDFNNPDLRDEFVSDYAFLYVGSNISPYYTFRNAQYNSQLNYITEQTLRLGPGIYTIRLVPVNQTYYTFFSANWRKFTYPAQRKGGGLRIKQIENYDSAGKKIVKKFLYNEGLLSTGVLLEPAAYDFPINVGGLSDCGGDSYAFNADYFVRSSNSNYVEGFMKSGTIGYGKVTEIIGENGEGGKTEYSFYNYAPTYSAIPSYPGDIYALDGKSLMTKYFDSGGSLKKKTSYAYDFVLSVPPGSPTSISGIKVLNFPWTTTAFYANMYSNPTIYSPVTQQIDVEYFGSDSIRTVKNYRYDNPVHKQMTKAEETSSSGELLTTNFQYADDLKSAGVPNIYNAMSDNNFHNAVIEQQFYKNNVFKQAKRTNYDFWKNNTWGDNTSTFYLPKSVETKQGVNSNESRINYNYYDRSGNLLEQSQSNGLHIAYLWGYEKQYPIAEIKNATYESLVTILGQSTIDHLSGNNPGSDESIRNALSNLRVSLPNAQVTTFTYSPLVGMTSMTDAKGQTTYYEYDTFQRLMNVKDQYGNILKHTDYHYQGQ